MTPQLSKELFNAVSRGDLVRLRRLLAQGSDVNCTDHNGMTPLTLAAYKGHQKVAEVLLLHGAKINVRNRFGLTPFKAALSQGHQPMVQLLQVFQQFKVG